MTRENTAMRNPVHSGKSVASVSATRKRLHAATKTQ